MKRRFTIGLVLALSFTLLNIGGGVYAGLMGEARHAALHFVLALAGTYVTWLVVARRRAANGASQLATAAGSPELASRLTNLEQSIDAIAVEVERVGEGQRFMTRLFTERREQQKDRE